MPKLNIVGECTPGINQVKDLITQLYPGEVENKKFYDAVRRIVGDQVFGNLLVYGSSQKDVMECCFDCWQHLHRLPLEGQLLVLVQFIG